MGFYGYSSIGQFRNVVSSVKKQYKDKKQPSLNFKGTAKAHGTNASVIIFKDGGQSAQSRTRELSIDNDNYSFALWHSDNIYLFKCLRGMIRVINKDIIFYGEWAGKGIQNKAAICQADRFFYLFGVKVLNGDGSHYWFSDYPSLSIGASIIDARDVVTYSIEIDFNYPENHLNQLAKLTEEVEKECPIGKRLGVTGIGEGIVWEHINDLGESLKFKVKGEKHSTSKIKKLVTIDPEKLEGINTFVDYSLTESRLDQGFNELEATNPDMSNIGEYLSWINRDIIKEESDTLVKSNLEYRDVQKKISLKAKAFYIDKISSF